MSDSKECKIIDTIDITRPRSIIETPCEKFLIAIEGYSIFRYCLETKQKDRIAGSVNQTGYKDGTRDESRFHLPRNLTLSKDLKTLFIADKGNCVIRAICAQTGIATTFAGQVGSYKYIDGPKEKACFYLPGNLKLSPDGNTLIVADACNLISICITTGQVNTIETFKNEIYDFAFHPDGKHIYICNWYQILKYNIKTNKTEIVLESEGFIECDISKDGQLLFILNCPNKHIKIFNIVLNDVIDIIITPFKPSYMSISNCGKKLYICDFDNHNIQVIDISKYCTNFKTFLQLQLYKHSFLPPQVINIF